MITQDEILKFIDNSDYELIGVNNSLSFDLILKNENKYYLVEIDNYLVKDINDKLKQDYLVYKRKSKLNNL